MGRMQVFLGFACAVAAAVTLAACGGDSSPEQLIEQQTQTTAEEELTKAEFIDEADARCEEANSQIASLVEQGEGFTGASEIADIRQGVLDEIRQLGPPAEDKAELDDFLNALEQQAEAGKKIGLAIDRNEDTSEFETELADAQAKAETAAKAYGFKECGSEITATDTGTATGTDSGSSSTGAVPVPVTPAPAAPVTPPSTGGGGTDTGGGSTGGTGGGVGIP